ASSLLFVSAPSLHGSSNAANGLRLYCTARCRGLDQWSAYISGGASLHARAESAGGSVTHRTTSCHPASRFSPAALSRPATLPPAAGGDGRAWPPGWHEQRPAASIRRRAGR